MSKNYYIALQNTYETIQIGLFQDEMMLDFHEIHKHLISKKFIEILNEVLKHHKITPSDLAYIVANNGPSPLTTLRAVLASINGINFAIRTPLIAVDGFMLLAQELNTTERTAVILNAFNNDVYFAYPHHEKIISGYKNIELLIPELIEQKITKIVGNALDIHKERILSSMPNIKLDAETSYSDLEKIAEHGCRLFEKGCVSEEIMPGYTKVPHYPTRSL